MIAAFKGGLPDKMGKTGPKSKIEPNNLEAFKEDDDVLTNSPKDRVRAIHGLMKSLNLEVKDPT